MSFPPNRTSNQVVLGGKKVVILENQHKKNAATDPTSSRRHVRIVITKGRKLSQFYNFTGFMVPAERNFIYKSQLTQHKIEGS